MKINLNVTPNDKCGSRNVLRRKRFQNCQKKRTKIVEKVEKNFSKSRKRFQNRKNFFKVAKTLSKSGFFFKTEKKNSNVTLL